MIMQQRAVAVASFFLADNLQQGRRWSGTTVFVQGADDRAVGPAESSHRSQPDLW